MVVFKCSQDDSDEEDYMGEEEEEDDDEDNEDDEQEEEEGTNLLEIFHFHHFTWNFQTNVARWLFLCATRHL